MIYTYQKRKELNKLFREAYPSYSYTEDKEGVPRMRIDHLPSSAKIAESLHALELMAYRYWEEHRQPMPVLLTPPKRSASGEVGPVDLNYVSHRSDKSLELAARYIGEGRLHVIGW